jgi:single-stranded-DNA-specific exonuclease
MQKSWIIKSSGEADNVAELAAALNINKVMANLLVQRGITSFDEAKTFFRPQLSELHDPLLMKDMAKATQRVQDAIERNEKILIYGDYDVDGTTSVSLVYCFLETIHEHLDYYIPDRYKEGYGISIQGIDYAAETGCKLVIALDCGIKAVKQAAHAKAKGIDLIICDHHRPGDELPDAYAVLDPKREDCSYPYDELSGCGIGFKLMQALADKRDMPFSSVESLLDLLVVSIAADIVPITGENRILAYYGLKRLNENPRQGLKTLIGLSKRQKELSIGDIVFQIGPRINAAGRIASGKKAVELLIAKDESMATEFGQRIDDQNAERKELDEAISSEAVAMLHEQPNWKSARSTVLYKEDWHKGVIGIVASRIIEKHYRPTIIFTKSNGKITGSARSVRNFDVYNAIDACSELLEQFGGHKYAAGITMKEENLQSFREKFEAVVASTLTAEQMIPQVSIDTELALDEITPKFYRVLKQLAPFGPGNMKPTFVAKKVNDTGWMKIVGKKHLKLNVRQFERSAVQFPVIAFGQGEYFDQVKAQAFDLAYTIEENEWNGETSLQLSASDLRFDE